MVGVRASLSADIRSLPREHKEPFNPDPLLIEHCYKLLDAAKKGDLRALAYCTVMHDGLTAGAQVGCGWAASGPATVFALTHALGVLERRWAHYCDEDPA